VAVVGRIVQKWYANGGTIHKTIQKHRMHKIENKKMQNKKQTYKEYSKT